MPESVAGDAPFFRRNYVATGEGHPVSGDRIGQSDEEASSNLTS
jgi:hypothetical protein